MKKILLLFLGILFCFSMQGQETLTFKLQNPRISFFSPTNYLVFDIMVKGSAGASYLYGSQIICNISIGNVNTGTPPSIALASGFELNYTIPTPPFTTAAKYGVTATWFSNNLNLAIAHNASFDSYYPAAYTSVPSTYVLLGSVYVPLVAGAVNGMSGISFLSGSMDGYQYYAIATPPYNAGYTSPNIYEGTNFSELYYGRMYSSGSGWTQFGGTMDWTTSVNTSVWDTLAAATTITGTVAGTECKAKALRIHSGARLKIDADHPLTATGGNTDIANERGLWITSTAAGTGSFKDNGTINYTNGGSVNVERYLSNQKWHYTCIPITSTLTNPLQGLYMTRYDETNHHFRYIISLDSTLNTQMLGYGIWPNTGNATVNFNGSLNTGGISVLTSRTYSNTTLDYDGWNLVGNPYPSTVDLSLATASWTSVEATAWFWDPINGNYYVYPSGGAGTHTKYAPPMQGFFVHCNASATPSTPGSGLVVFQNTARVHNTEAFLKEAEVLPNLLTIDASGSVNSYTDKLNVYFDPNRTTDYEGGFDALKFPGSWDAPQIYTVNAGENLTVNALPFNTQHVVVPMGFSSGVDGNYTLKADNLSSFSDNVSISLEDLKLQVVQDLKVSSAYDFTYHSGDDANRFLLHFNDPYLGSTEVAKENAVAIFSYGNAVYVKISANSSIKGTLIIYDLLGRKVFQETLVSTPVNKFETGLGHGNYIVTVTTEQGTFNTKVYLQ